MIPSADISGVTVSGNFVQEDAAFPSGGQCTMTTTPPAPSPTQADALVPKFQPLPGLKCPSWATEGTRKFFETLKSEETDLGNRQSKLITKVQKRLTADPMTISTSKPGQKQRDEYQLLASEVLFRQKVADYYEMLDEEGADEDRVRVEALIRVRKESEQAVVSALAALGIDREWYSDRLFPMVEASESVRAAMRHCRSLDSFRDRLKVMNHTNLIRRCRDRMKVLADELIAMC